MFLKNYNYLIIMATDLISIVIEVMDEKTH